LPPYSFLIDITALAQAIIFYLLSPVYNWGKDKVGYYGALASASNGIGLCLIIPAFTLFGQYVALVIPASTIAP